MLARATVGGMLAAAGMLALAVACKPGGAFACVSDLDCVRASEQGFCEGSGFCSFDDGECDSGRRYGEHAGDGLAGQCVEVPPVGTSTGPGTTTVDPSSSVTSSTLGVLDMPPNCDDWWNENWRYRRQLTIRDVSGSLTDFPAALIVSDIATYEEAANLGTDLRFVDEAGLQLAHEVENWVEGEDSVVWVLLPQLTVGTIAVYWGNNGAGNVEDPDTVWSNGYIAVWHLNDLNDSTGNGHGGSGSAMSIPGRVGTGRQFQQDAGVTISAGGALDNLFQDGATITAWIRPSTWGGGDAGRIVDRATLTQGQDGWAFQVRGDAARDSLRFTKGFTTAYGRWNTAQDTIVLDTWHHVGVSYTADENETPVFYIDGEESAPGMRDTPSGLPDEDVATPMAIGDHLGVDQRFFEGTIDEIRISSDKRDPEWIEAEYLSMTEGLFEEGSVEERPCDPFD